jgi:hypothetical protein
MKIIAISVKNDKNLIKNIFLKKLQKIEILNKI